MCPHLLACCASAADAASCAAAVDGSHNDLFDNMTSMWGPNVPKPEWPPSGLPDAEGFNIMESRTRGGVDQSYSMLYPNLFWNRYGCWHSVTNVTPTGVVPPPVRNW